MVWVCWKKRAQIKPNPNPSPQFKAEAVLRKAALTQKRP